MVHHTTHVVWGVLLLVVATTGCRTYGQYGATEDTQRKIEQAVRSGVLSKADAEKRLIRLRQELFGEDRQ